MGAESTWRPGAPEHPPTPFHPGRAAGALLAGIVVQIGFFYFWQVAGSALAAPMLAPFGRGPDQLVGLLLPALGAFVAASFHPRGWWWLGPAMAFPALMSAHLLFAAGIEITYGRSPTMAEEWRFLGLEGHRFVAGCLGSYIGALLQRE